MRAAFEEITSWFCPNHLVAIVSDVHTQGQLTLISDHLDLLKLCSVRPRVKQGAVVLAWKETCGKLVSNHSCTSQFLAFLCPQEFVSLGYSWI